MPRPLSKPSRRCRFGDTDGEVQAERLGQSSRLAQSIHTQKLKDVEKHFGTVEVDAYKSGTRGETPQDASRALT